MMFKGVINMKNKLLCVMAGYDDDTEKYLSQIQEKLYEQGFRGTQTKNIPQHITLGTFDIEKEDELVNLLNSIAQKTNSFDITFNHIGIFNGSKVLFVAPDTSKDLIELKEMFEDSSNWTPHTTMIIDEPDVIFKAMPIVLDSFESFKGKVESIHLYEFWPANHILSISLLSNLDNK